MGVVNVHGSCECKSLATLHTAHLQEMNLIHLTSDTYTVTVYIHASHPNIFGVAKHFLGMIHLACFRNHLIMR